MVDWQTVRYDPTYTEPLDPEIVALCDALNAAGFVTISSCCGHGYGWPHVCFEHSTDERIERLARFVKSREVGDYRPYFSMWQKEVLETGYHWHLELHLNNCYAATPQAESMIQAQHAIDHVTAQINEWAASEVA